MPWVKLDDKFPEHRKVARLTPPAFMVFIMALCYCSRNLTDGEIPATYVKMLGGPRRFQELIHAGLVDEVDGTYWIHDYLDYNPSRVQVEQDREVARQRINRWRNARTNAVTNDVPNAVVNGFPDPDPDPQQRSTSDPDQPAPEARKKRARAATRKVQPAITDAYRAVMHERYARFGTPAEIDEQIELALGHDQAFKQRRHDLYVNNWLRREYVDGPYARRGRGAPAPGRDHPGIHGRGGVGTGSDGPDAPGGAGFPVAKQRPPKGV